MERRALAHAPCGACVKLSSVKQKGLRSNAREGRCCSKLSTRCSFASDSRSRPSFDEFEDLQVFVDHPKAPLRVDGTVGVQVGLETQGIRGE